MGELNIQIKLLEGKSPILFTWWNKENNTAEGCLITCACQKYNLSEKSKVVVKKGKHKKFIENAISRNWTLELGEALQQAEIVSIPVGGDSESILHELDEKQEMLINKSDIFKEKREGLVEKKGGEGKEREMQDGGGVIKGDSSGTGFGSSEGEQRVCDVNVKPDDAEAIHKDIVKDDGIMQKEDESNDMNMTSEDDMDDYSEMEIHRASEDVQQAENSLDEESEGMSDTEEKVEVNLGHCDVDGSAITLTNNAGDDNSMSNKNVTFVNHRMVNTISDSSRVDDKIGLAENDNQVMISVDPSQSNHGGLRGLDFHNQSTDNHENDLTNSRIQVSGEVINVGDISGESVVVLHEGKEPISEVDRALFEALKGFIESQNEEGKEADEWNHDLNPDDNQQNEAELDPVLQPNPVYTINTPAMVKYREHKNKLYLKKLHQTSPQTTICEICGSILSNKQISKHMQSIHSSEERVRKYECNTCGKKFFKTDSLVRHVRTHYEPTFHCKHCDKSFRHNFQLHNHEKAHMGFELPKRIHKPRYKTLHPKPRQSVKNLEEADEKQVSTCHLCDSKMSTKSLRRHMHMQHADVVCGPHQCDKCNQKYSTDARLKTHKLTHDGLRFKCTFCEQIFTENMERVQHERTHLGDSRRPAQGSVKFKCGYCVKSYSRERDRLQHEMSHFDPSIDLTHGRRNKVYPTINKFVQCQICNKTLRQNSMKCHMDSHNGKTWTCEICGKTISKGARYDHVKIHTQTKDHHCSYCEAKFHTKHALVAHVRKHTKEKPIPCRYCQRMFSRYEGRNNHERIHTGERPFQCDLCQKSWRDRPTYSQHMKKYHPGVPLMQRKRPGSALIPALPGVQPS